MWHSLMIHEEKIVVFVLHTQPEIVNNEESKMHVLYQQNICMFLLLLKLFCILIQINDILSYCIMHFDL